MWKIERSQNFGPKELKRKFLIYWNSEDYGRKRFGVAAQEESQVQSWTKLWCLLVTQVDIYHSELQRRCPDWRYKFSIGQSISGIQKHKIEWNYKGRYCRRGPKIQSLPRFRCVRDEEKSAQESERVIVNTIPWRCITQIPLKEGLASQLKEVCWLL